jgi:hypothetical protein
MFQISVRLSAGINRGSAKWEQDKHSMQKPRYIIPVSWLPVTPKGLASQGA